MRNRNFAKSEIEVPAKIQLKHHEGAIVCSLEHRISGDPDNLKEIVYSTISEIAEWTIQQGGLVGHIKASLQTSCGNLIYSCRVAILKESSRSKFNIILMKFRLQRFRKY